MLYLRFENHTDLLINRSEVDNLFSKLDTLFNTLKSRYENSNISQDVATFTRLKDSQSLSVYVGIGNDNNPYLFTYNSKTKVLSNNLPYDVFKILDKDVIMGDLEDRIRHIDNPKYNAVIVPPLERELKKMAQYFDENPNIKSMEVEVDYDKD